jgi:hypothetical protein
MVSYEVTELGKLMFTWPDIHTRKGFTTRKLDIPAGMHDGYLTALSDAVVRRASRLSEQSCASYLNALSRILRNINCCVAAFPPVNWDAYLYNHFSSHLEDEKTSYSTRVADWHRVREIYIEIQRRDFIPINALIPSASVQGGCHDSGTQPIGHETIRLPVPVSLDELLPKWRLSEPGLELDDDLYIEKLKEKLQLASNTIIAACIDYWQTMRKCHQIGKDLIEKIPENDVHAVLSTGKYIINGVHLAHPSEPLGISWFLATLRYYLIKTTALSAISSDQLMEIPFFRPIIYNERNRKLLLKKLREIVGDNSVDGKTITESLCRLLGLLSNRDCAAACCILISENPSFPPYSLVTADLYTQAGKFYLRARNGGKRLIFSVDKPRAGSRKTSQLPPLSSQIVADLIESTDIARINMRNRKKATWRKLFLVANHLQIGCSGRAAAKIMAFNNGTTLYSVLQPKLEKAGIVDRDFNLSTLRTTQGILAFLQHGSLRKVADILNNTVQVVRSSYIPQWLIVRWATRAIRIMQQKIIVVATEGAPWQLEASDFLTADALRLFISKMLRELKNGDAFSEMIKKKLGKYMTQADQTGAQLDAELIIGVDERSLGAMYTYVALYPEPPHEDATRTSQPPNGTLVMKDEDIRQITTLLTSTARLINDELTMVESAIVDKITDDSIAEFRHLHRNALIQAARCKDFLEAADAAVPASPSGLG